MARVDAKDFRRMQYAQSPVLQSSGLPQAIAAKNLMTKTLKPNN
jgi:hypothetical protein